MIQLSLPLWDENESDEDVVEDQHVVRCRRCHRILKNPKHIELGYGLTCYKKNLAETRKYKKLFEIERGQN